MVVLFAVKRNIQIKKAYLRLPGRDAEGGDRREPVPTARAVRQRSVPRSSPAARIINNIFCNTFTYCFYKIKTHGATNKTAAKAHHHYILAAATICNCRAGMVVYIS